MTVIVEKSHLVRELETKVPRWRARVAHSAGLTRQAVSYWANRPESRSYKIETAVAKLMKQNSNN